MNEVQEKILEILLDVHSVLDKHGVPHYLIYGTALGAIREKGFIPWDDDADICIMRRDLSLFLDALTDLDPDKYFIQYPDTGDYMFSFFKIKMNGTTYIERNSADHDIHHGVFIDVFVEEDMPDGLINRSLYKAVASVYEISSLCFYNVKFKPVMAMVRRIRPLLVRIMDLLCGDAGSSERVSVRDEGFLTGVVRRDCFGTPRMVPFEGYLLPVPEKYDEYLTKLFGDYMVPHKEDERRLHDVLVSDMNKDYREYMKDDKK